MVDITISIALIFIVLAGLFLYLYTRQLEEKINLLIESAQSQLRLSEHLYTRIKLHEKEFHDCDFEKFKAFFNECPEIVQKPEE